MYSLELLNLFWYNQSSLGYSSDVDFSYDYYGTQKPPPHLNCYNGELNKVYFIFMMLSIVFD